MAERRDVPVHDDAAGLVVPIPATGSPCVRRAISVAAAHLAEHARWASAMRLIGSACPPSDPSVPEGIARSHTKSRLATERPSMSWRTVTFASEPSSSCSTTVRLSGSRASSALPASRSPPSRTAVTSAAAHEREISDDELHSRSMVSFSSFQETPARSPASISATRRRSSAAVPGSSADATPSGATL